MVHRIVSVQQNQRDEHFIQFIKNQEPLYVSSVTCSSSGGATQTTLGILGACDINYRSILQNHVFTNTKQKYIMLLPFEREMFAVS